MAVKVADTIESMNSSFPAMMGTSINVSIGGVEESLQDAIDNGDITGSTIQVDDLPSPSAEYANVIYQYIGDSGTYVNGFFYQCISNGGDPATYSWVRKDVQPNETDVLKEVNALPTPSVSNVGTCYFLKSTQVGYTKGGVYQCQEVEMDTYAWVNITSSIGSNITYSNSTSGLSATNVQNAIDEVVNGLGTASTKDYTDVVRPNSHDLVESMAVYSAINQAVDTVYTPRGDLTCAELTSELLIEDNIGNVYQMTDSGVTSSLFINGAGKTIEVNDNVGIIKAGEDICMFNLMGNAFDLHGYQKEELTTPLTIGGSSRTTVESALDALNTYKSDKDVTPTAFVGTMEEWNDLSVDDKAKYSLVNIIDDDITKSEIDVYSTSEVKTNKVWIDGKPIYRVVRHVWDTGNVPATGYTFSGTTLSGPLTNNAESFIKVAILCKNIQGSWQELEGNGENGPTQNFVWLNDNSAYFINGGVLEGAWAIFEYTKTTD